MPKIEYIDPKTTQFRRRPSSIFLDVCLNGKWTEGVHLLRSFPLSSPREYISIRDNDQKEVGLIRSIDEFDADRELIEQELDRRYFTPAITKINSLKHDASMWKFDVETTRGHSDFYVRNWRDSAYELTPGRWQITSVDGGRFEIIDLNELDDRSQILIEQLL